MHAAAQGYRRPCNNRMLECGRARAEEQCREAAAGRAVAVHGLHGLGAQWIMGCVF